MIHCQQQTHFNLKDINENEGIKKDIAKKW